MELICHNKFPDDYSKRFLKNKIDKRKLVYHQRYYAWLVLIYSEVAFWVHWNHCMCQFANVLIALCPLYTYIRIFLFLNDTQKMYYQLIQCTRKINIKSMELIVTKELRIIKVLLIQCFMLLANINKYASFFFFLPQKHCSKWGTKRKVKIFIWLDNSILKFSTTCKVINMIYFFEILNRNLITTKIILVTYVE